MMDTAKDYWPILMGLLAFVVWLALTPGYVLTPTNGRLIANIRIYT